MIGALLGAGAAGMALSSVLGSILSPATRGITHFINTKIPNELLPLNLVAEAQKRGITSPIDLYKELLKTGLNKEHSDIIFKLNKVLLDVSSLVNLRWRDEITLEDFHTKANKLGLINEDSDRLFKLFEKFLPPAEIIQGIWRGIKYGEGLESYKKELQQQGWTKERIDVLLKTAKFYPSPQDLINWQAKEVFEPDAIKKYGLEDEFELLEKKAFYKAGMSDEQIKNYWKAHWEHPSLIRIEELLHRTDLTEKDVWEWFRLVEIPPYWRDKLIQVMYRPYTRVDVRRMYNLGVLDRKGVKRSYLDLGYNEEKAENMTEFTIRYYEDKPEEEKSTEEKREDELQGLTRTAIIKQYQNNILTRENAGTYLKEIGLAEEVAEFYLDNADYETEERYTENQIDTIHDLYIQGRKNEAEIVDLLNRINLPPERVDTLIENWDNEIDRKLAMPSKAELAKMADKEIITVPRFKKEMEAKGYKEEVIGWYVKFYGLAPA